MRKVALCSGSGGEDNNVKTLKQMDKRQLGNLF